MVVSSNVKLIYPLLASATDAQLSALSDAAQKWAVTTFGTDITPGVKCETITSTHEQILFLNHRPVEYIQSIKVNDVEWVDRTGVNWSADGKLWLGMQRFWNQAPGWRPGVNNIHVTYFSRGQSQDVIDLLLGAIMNWWFDANKRSMTVSSESIGDYSYVQNTAFLKGIPVQVANAWAGYRIVRAC